MDDFKKHIAGHHGNRSRMFGTPATQTCPCCRETDKRHSRKLARRRLRQEDRERGRLVAPEGERDAGGE